MHQVGFICKDIQQIDIWLIAIVCGGRNVIAFCVKSV